MRTATRSLPFGALALMLLAASCREKQQAASTPATDTTPSGPLEDTDPTPAPEAQASRIGQLPLLRGAPLDARCSTSGVAAPRLILEGDYPIRIITIGVGDSTRQFRPTYLQVSSKQAGTDGKEENETIYVGFTETGSVESGRRQYFVTGTPPKDASPLLADDAELAKQLALQVLERCKQ